VRILVEWNPHCDPLFGLRLGTKPSQMVPEGGDRFLPWDKTSHTRAGRDGGDVDFVAPRRRVLTVPAAHRYVSWAGSRKPMARSALAGPAETAAEKGGDRMNERIKFFHEDELSVLDGG
jgi:hypothetical protein